MGGFGSADQSNAGKSCRFRFREAPVKISVHQVVEFPGLCSEFQVVGSALSGKDLEYDHTEGVHVALLRKSSSGGILWSKVPHCGAAFKSGENYIVGEKSVQTGAGEQWLEMVVDQNVVRRYVLVN